MMGHEGKGEGKTMERDLNALPGRCGFSTLCFSSDVRIESCAAVASSLEATGLLAGKLDKVYDDPHAGQTSWEKAERSMLCDAVSIALRKSGRSEDTVDAYLAGDLLNQIITASLSAKQFKIPFLGMYGACSTSMLTLANAAALVDGGYARSALAATSSHRATSERQFRYPVEYGGQKPLTTQCTITGAGAAVVARGGSGVRITHATLGCVVDCGMKNPLNMGATMAPAAADTILTHFHDTGRKPEDYDLIVTGDLASVGFSLVQELLRKRGWVLGDHFMDCGLMIYPSTSYGKSPIFAGGSGCGCSAIVTYGHILPLLQKKQYHRVLVIATGSLLSPLSFQQGENIPGVAHAVAFAWQEERDRVNS